MELNYLASKECLRKEMWIWEQLDRSRVDRDKNENGPGVELNREEE
jgi:hypothetical protein